MRKAWVGNVLILLLCLAVPVLAMSACTPRGGRPGETEQGSFPTPENGGNAPAEKTPVPAHKETPRPSEAPIPQETAELQETAKPQDTSNPGEADPVAETDKPADTAGPSETAESPETRKLPRPRIPPPDLRTRRRIRQPLYPATFPQRKTRAAAKRRDLSEPSIRQNQPESRRRPAPLRLLRLTPLRRPAAS